MATTSESLLISLKAVSEEIRLRILLLLLDREACVCELMEVFGMAQSKLSHHLITLRDAGFLEDERRGKWNYYRAPTGKLDRTNRDIILSVQRWCRDLPLYRSDLTRLNDIQGRKGICA